MSLTGVAHSEIPSPPGRRAARGSGALAAGVGALSAAVSGLLLTCGIGLVLWAVTPSSVGGPQQTLRACVAAFAAGNAMTLTIGRAALTIPPLMITIIAVALLAGISGRGGAANGDRTGELTHAATAAAVYAAAVTTAGVVLGTRGTVAAEQWWRPGLLALVVVGTTVLARGSAWRSQALQRSPAWVPVAVRLGAAGAAGILAVGGGAVVLGLVASFGHSTTVQTLAAPGASAGLGMALLGLAYLPNAIVAGAGYATGAGFHIGAGTYAPFGSSPVDLPAVPLLAAAPDGRGASTVGLALMLLPVLLALLIGRAATRRLGARRDRLLAVGTGAVVAGLLLGLVAAVAGGGVTGGRWAAIGAPPLLLGGVTTLVLAGFGAVVAGLARQTAVFASDAVTSDVAADAIPTEAEPDSTADGTSDPSAADEPTAVADAEPMGDQLTETAESAIGIARTDELPAAVSDEALDQDAVSNTLVDDAATDEAVVDLPHGRETPDPQEALEPGEMLHPGAQTRSGEQPEADDLTQPGERPKSDESVTATVPPARREEDVLAGTRTSADVDLVDLLRPRAPRQVG